MLNTYYAILNITALESTILKIYKNMHMNMRIKIFFKFSRSLYSVLFGILRELKQQQNQNEIKEFPP